MYSWSGQSTLGVGMGWDVSQLPGGGGRWRYKAFSLSETLQGDGPVKDYIGEEEWPSYAVSEKSFLCPHHKAF